MTQDQAAPRSPDLARGIAISELRDGGKLIGHVGDEEVLVVRLGAQVFAVGAH
jgi:apoptosis-inducing factor 3